MAWRNGPTSFGLASRTLHWLTAALILAQLPLGLKIATMQLSLANLWLFGLHKTLGFCALVLVLIRVIWHRISPPPPPIGGPAALASRAARAVHGLIYLCLLVIPLSGWVASAATGLDVVIFGQITLPAIAPVSEAWEKTGFLIHAIATKLLIALLLAHIGGAALRAVKRDGTLSRMIHG